MRRRILLVQLPIPQPGLEPAHGNVPLAAGYLKLFARDKGLEHDFEIEILPTEIANRFGDQGLVTEIVSRRPWMVGFTCYLWNINRSLWIAEQVKTQVPGMVTLFGGPEITADNRWVLDSAGLDYAAIGEGEQTFAELLASFQTGSGPQRTIPGLYVSPRAAQTLAQASVSVTMPAADVSIGARGANLAILNPVVDASAGTPGDLPPFRTPLPNLNAISSPYLSGILDAADEGMLLLETIRGCIFKCKFCYYPKSYDDLYFVSREKIIANLQHARDRQVREVVLLDPTLNQRKEFGAFLRLLAEQNPERAFTYFGELRSEGITPEIARLLAEANFTEVEIGLQSVDPLAQELMDRTNNLKAFERGVRAMRAAGIRVKVDLIIGLPGDTVESIRRGMRYLRDSELCDLVQVFNLAILPGTAFRQEAEQLGLKFQPQPPYYVLRTPTLETSDFYQLMAEAQEIFDTEFDPLPEPQIPEHRDRSSLTGQAGSSPADVDGGTANRMIDACLLDLDRPLTEFAVPHPADRTQAFTVWFRGQNLHEQLPQICDTVAALLADNPHTTLQILLEPCLHADRIAPEFLVEILRTSYRTTSYLDHFYAMSPGRRKGAKRIVLLLPWESRAALGREWIESRGDYADLVWRDAPEPLGEFNEFEYVLSEAT